MKSRWNRVCTICAVILLAGAGIGAAAENTAVPAETAAAQPTAPEITPEPERVIDPGALPEHIVKLLETAAQEIGYTEETGGYTKYGAWTGEPYAQWCAEFICWSVHMTDQLYGTAMLNVTYPFYTGRNTGRDWFIARGRFVFRRGYQPGWGWQWLKNGAGLMRTNEYIPLPGDLVYFSYGPAGDTAHVALVEYCAYGPGGGVNIHVIEGNNPESVQRAVYPLDNSQILGFGCWGDVVDTTMQYGNTGDKVLALQQSLGRLGYLSQRHYTSTYASNTRQAVLLFQQTMPGKTPTGVADRETQLAIGHAIEKLEFDDPNSWLVSDGT